MAALAGALAWALVPVAAEAQSAPSALPEGEGRELVEAVCTGCHQTNQITRSSGYSRAGWQELTATMIDLSASPQQQGRIIEYLATHFPPHDRRAPKLVPGAAEIAFREWQVPTLGQRARSGRGAGRLDLVGRAVRQSGRADRARDRRDDGIPFARGRDAAFGDPR